MRSGCTRLSVRGSRQTGLSNRLRSPVGAFPGRFGVQSRTNRGSGAVSSPGESHPQALSEPYVRLSPHTAPSVQPPRPLDGLAIVQGSSSAELARNGFKLDHQRPFGPFPLQELQPYYERFCPCAPLRYSGTRGVLHLRRSLRIGTTGSPVPHRSLISCSRRLYAGHQ